MRAGGSLSLFIILMSTNNTNFLERNLKCHVWWLQGYNRPLAMHTAVLPQLSSASFLLLNLPLDHYFVYWSLDRNDDTNYI